MSGVCVPSALHPCAGKHLAAVSATWKWQTKAETAGTTVNADELAIAVLQLDATPAASIRRRYIAARIVVQPERLGASDFIQAPTALVDLLRIFAQAP